MRLSALPVSVLGRLSQNGSAVSRPYDARAAPPRQVLGAALGEGRAGVVRTTFAPQCASEEWTPSPSASPPGGRLRGDTESVGPSGGRALREGVGRGPTAGEGRGVAPHCHGRGRAIHSDVRNTDGD